MGIPNPTYFSVLSKYDFLHYIIHIIYYSEAEDIREHSITEVFN